MVAAERCRKKGPRVEFHISRQARDRYQFDASLFSLTGTAIIANFYAARVLAQKINDLRDLVRFPEQAVRAGQINAMGLIDEIQHYVINLYRQEIDRQVIAHALAYVNGTLGADQVDQCLRAFAAEFPPLAVYQQQASLPEYIAGETDGTPNRQVLLEEMLMLWLANANPAFAPHLELFDDAELDRQTAYQQIIDQVHTFFDSQPVFGPDRQNLLDMLRAPAIAVPHSLTGQLEYIRERWGYLLGRYLYRILGSLDLISEEEKVIFAGPGPAIVYDFAGMDAEYERFSLDLDWMPQVVLLAKNTYVWLDQLSRKYDRPITRLDQIPDQELDTLARWGFTGLWLIGLWERSRASERIKQLCGNPEAVASAYSLYDYQIAADLGGYEACEDLRRRAWQRGIRLASDMVPNHIGIDSWWVIEHPDWFIGQDHSPFPAYTFTGPNLSSDPRVGIFLEDHYYDRTDAAVVFKWRDEQTGRERYIFHGNDGTSMPWNDTAQLDYRNPEVREAVAQKILQVARQFPIIRFDAAMTLTKRHYQRLWFPEPGTGGAIPGRAEHALTKQQFNDAMPAEFWRDIVDRVADETPDTLLLAEAFWLMEAYFVRTLGMHRVYNSAFMNMLRDEKNAEYRLVIKNTLEFDPRILKRYVNFMNNPDERTAVDQFGRGDKYLGICTLMVTMPGLPMFGHGQIEGFTEKYGMEYRRAYWDEKPDKHLIERHEREIFTLLRRRRLFADVGSFLLYDVFSPQGYVNEDIFCYSNRIGDDRALVIYHNKYAEAQGWIRTSTAFLDLGGDQNLAQKSLGEGLALHNDHDAFCIFRDHSTNMEYIRSSQELFDRGLFIELHAYQYHVFLDFQEVWDDESHPYARLTSFLDGRGVPSIQEALTEIVLQPVCSPFRELMSADMVRRIWSARQIDVNASPDPELLQVVEKIARDLLTAARETVQGHGDAASIAREIRRELETVLRVSPLSARALAVEHPTCTWAIQRVEARLKEPESWGTLLGWLFTHSLSQIVDGRDNIERSRSWLDEWLLAKIAAESLQALGLERDATACAVTTIRFMVTHQRWFAQASTPIAAHRVLELWLRDQDARQILRINRHQGILWFNQEAFEELLDWMLVIAVLDGLMPAPSGEAQGTSEMADRCRVIYALNRAAAMSGYRVERLLEIAQTQQAGALAPSQLGAPETFDLVVHATHEAGIKVGGIGAVLEGLLAARAYNERITRTILVGPMNTKDSTELERLTAPRNQLEIRYSSHHSLDGTEPNLGQALRAVEQTYHVKLLYGRRAFGPARHEVLLIDASDADPDMANAYKARLYHHFGIQSERYESDPEYNQTIQAAVPGFEALQILTRDAGPQRCIIAHEFMGLPLCYSAIMHAPDSYRTIFYGHEVATIRPIVELHPGHDTMFYNVLELAQREGLYLEDVFGDQTSFFKHALIRPAASRCDNVFAVGDRVVQEMRFLGPDWAQANIDQVYNGIPSYQLSLDAKLSSRDRLGRYCYNLLGYTPDYVFTHVTRLIPSKGLWRDIRVMEHLDPLLARQGKSAVMFVLSTAIPIGRPARAIAEMENLYGWPVQHRETPVQVDGLDVPDLISHEIPFYRAIEQFNHQAQSSKIVLVNQFGWSQDRCGRRMPDDMTFADIRQGTDVEFGQSVYEPFGIAQLEPLSAGALCVVSNVCGCLGFVQRVTDGHTPNLVVADYTSLSQVLAGSTETTLDLHMVRSIGQGFRDQIESEQARIVASKIADLLPRDQETRLQYLERGYALSQHMSWDVVVNDYLLPGLLRAFEHDRK